MSVYTVHEPPLRAAEASPDPERFVFVRDGFYFWAFLLTPLWMLWHRLWLVLVALRRRRRGRPKRHAFMPASAPGGSRLACCSSLSWPASRRARCAASRWRGAAGGKWVSSAAAMPKPPSGDFSTPGPMPRPASRSDAVGFSARAAAVATADAANARHRRPVSRTRGIAVTVAIVDYGSGNLHSAAKAFERAAHDAGIDQPIVVTNDPHVVDVCRPRRAARRRRVRRLPPRARRRRRHGRGA